jgi:hypothetical protein
MNFDDDNNPDDFDFSEGEDFEREEKNFRKSPLYLKAMEIFKVVSNG